MDLIESAGVHRYFPAPEARTTCIGEIMIGKISLLGGAAVLALFITSVPAQSADFTEPGCVLSGSAMAGIMYDWQEIDENGSDQVDIDWTTPFGEGAGLVTCGGFNVQADFAYYAHSGDEDSEDVESSDEDFDRSNSHLGGALFYRDPASWAAGLQASWISQSVSGSNVDVYRVGLFGEAYLNDTFTLGLSAAYHDGDSFFESSESGFELAAYGRFYATPDLSLMLRGDFLTGNSETFDGDGDLDGYAITAEAEYLVWDQGLSLFGGARYAERDHEINNFDFDSTETQVFGGIKFYFGQDGTLVERQRTGPVDNTSVFEEKLPNTLFDFPS